MGRYLLSRIVSGLILAVGVVAITFLIFEVLPAGDPAVVKAGRFASPEQVEAVRSALGLDDSVVVRFGIFFERLITHFDLGSSYVSGVPVTGLVGERIRATALLLLGVPVGVVAGVVLGARAAASPRSKVDRMGGALFLLFVASPIFWLGYMVLYLFGEESGALLPVLPGVGSYLEAGSLGGRLAAMIMPWSVLVVSLAAVYFRLAREVVGDELQQDHVLAARARGLSERRILWRHAVRAGISPMLVVLGIDIGLIVAGNMVMIETVFNIPGLGSLLTQSISQLDLPVIEGLVLLSGLTLIVVTIVVDLVHARLDPRVRLSPE